MPHMPGHTNQDHPNQPLPAMRRGAKNLYNFLQGKQLASMNSRNDRVNPRLKPPAMGGPAPSVPMPQMKMQSAVPSVPMPQMKMQSAVPSVPMPQMSPQPQFPSARMPQFGPRPKFTPGLIPRNPTELFPYKDSESTQPITMDSLREPEMRGTPIPRAVGASNVPRDRVPAPSRPAFTPPSAGPAPGVSPAAPAPQVSLQPSGPVPATARKADSKLPPGFADLESQRKAGTLPFQLDQQQRQSEYERGTAATPQRPGVDEDLQDRLRAKYGGPNFRSRSVTSEGLGDGRDFDRMREADAAAEADFVMPTVGGAMNRDFRGMDPAVADKIRAGDARRRERRGTPDPGTPEADQLFRDQRQRRRDRSEANMPIRQYRAMMQNQQELAPVTFGGQGTPYTNVARRFNQGPGLMERTLAATRMVRGDRLQDEKIERDRFVNDRDFGERQRQFNENTALAQGRLDFETKNAADLKSLNAEREANRHLVATGQLSVEEGQLREDQLNNEVDRKIKQEAHDESMKSTSSVNQLTQMDADQELENAKFADAGVTDNYSSGPLRHSEQSVVQMQQALTDPSLSKEEKTQLLRKRYGITNQNQLNAYLRASNYEEDHAFSLFGSEDGTQGSALNPYNWFNWYQSYEDDEIRNNIQGASPLR